MCTLGFWDRRIEINAHTSSPRTGLIIRCISPALAQAEGLTSGNHTIAFKIGFIADDNNGDVLVVFDADDLLAQLLELVQGRAGGDGEDEEETLAGFHVQFSEEGG